MTDLDARGLLETTTIIWMGEFGRTPRINQGRGRDHFPNAWSAVLAGGGIKGGQAYGKTTEDGMKVDGEPTSVPDLLATLCKALGIDHTKTNQLERRPADPHRRQVGEDHQRSDCLIHIR